MSEQDLFERFLEQMERWSRTYEKPSLADWNMRASLEMQESRLRSKGILRKVEYTLSGRVRKVGESVIGQLFNGYNKRANAAVGTKKTEYFRGEQCIFKHQLETNFYQMIRQPLPGNENWKNDTYVCPNCGNISKVIEFEKNGCEYCGTRFRVSEMYPKVTNFYALDSGIDKSISLRKIMKLFVGCFLFATAICACGLLTDIFSGIEITVEEMIPMMYVGTYIWGILLYPVIFQIADSMKVLHGMRGAKRKVTLKLRKLDPAFSYDYFEGKALSLLRMIVFAEQPTECAQYIGSRLAPQLADIVDLEYRGGLGVKKIVQNEKYLEVVLAIFVKNTYYNRKIKQKNETIIIHMRHSIDFPVAPEFSIVKFECHGCGGSFDATKHEKCPFCGRKYDVAMDDWEVLDIMIS